MQGQGIVTYWLLAVNPETGRVSRSARNMFRKPTEPEDCGAAGLTPELAGLFAECLPFVLQVVAGEFGESGHRVQGAGRLFFVAGMEGGASALDGRGQLPVCHRLPARGKHGQEASQQGRFRVLSQRTVARAAVVQISIGVADCLKSAV